MNLAFKYPVIFWNTACLITDSGGASIDSEGKNNNYDKIAIAIGKMRQANVNVAMPNINKSSYTFSPSVSENKIYFGFRGMLNIGDDFIKDIIANRPYESPKDFVQRVKPKKQSMISLIKGGAFDEMEDRKFVMAWYLWEECDKKSKLTLQNLPGLIKYGFIPKETPEQILAKRVYEFNRYLKAVCKINADFYRPDERATNFLIEIGAEELIGADGLIKAKAWDKQVYQKHMDVFRNWLSQNQDKVLQELNDTIFLEDWRKYAGNGNISAWEMEALCFYYHEHELAHINNLKYGYVDFFSQPEEPIVSKTLKRGGKEINLFNLVRICGTCIAKDKQKGLVTLLTTTGVVSVKFRKEHFAIFDKRISQRNPDGTKSIIENSWFTRGSMIAITGIRSGDNFIVKKYSTTPGASLYRIKEVLPNGELVLTDTREQGEAEEEEEG